MTRGGDCDIWMSEVMIGNFSLLLRPVVKKTTRFVAVTGHTTVVIELRRCYDIYRYDRIVILLLDHKEFIERT